MSMRTRTGAAIGVAALIGAPATALPAVGPGFGAPPPTIRVTSSTHPPLPFEHGGRRSLAPPSIAATATGAHDNAGNGAGALTVLIIAAGTLLVGAATGFEGGRLTTRRRVVRT